MSSQPSTQTDHTSYGLRTRFSPKTRVGQGLISAAPWLNIVLLVIFFILVESRIVIQPGVIVNLPTAPFSNGSVPALTAVILATPDHTGSSDTMVFFDDDRFLMDTPAHRQNLAARLTHAIRTRNTETLVLYADQHIPHGVVMDLTELARSAGIRKINMAIRTP